MIELDEAVEQARKSKYASFIVNGYKVNIQMPLFPMPGAGNRPPLVVQGIGYQGHHLSRPKRSAAFLWEALENKAKELNVALYIQSVQIPKLAWSLINERGYTPQSPIDDKYCCVDLIKMV